MRHAFAAVITEDLPANQVDGYWTADSLYDTRPFYEKIPFEAYVIGTIALIILVAVALGTVAFIRFRKNPKKKK